MENDNLLEIIEDILGESKKMNMSILKIKYSESRQRVLIQCKKNNFTNMIDKEINLFVYTDTSAILLIICLI